LPADAGGTLQFQAPAVRRGDAVIDCTPDRVIWIAGDAASSPGQLDRPCAKACHLLAPWAGREDRPRHAAQRKADEEAPAEAAAVLSVVCHLSISLGGC